MMAYGPPDCVDGFPIERVLPGNSTDSVCTEKLSQSRTLVFLCITMSEELSTDHQAQEWSHSGVVSFTSAVIVPRETRAVIRSPRETCVASFTRRPSPSNTRA